MTIKIELPLDSLFWSKWQKINGLHVTPAYGRKWTDVQKKNLCRNSASALQAATRKRTPVFSSVEKRRL